MDAPNDCVILTGRLFPNGHPARIHIEGGRITAVRAAADLDEPDGVQHWIVPGFFDLQVNGFAGRSFAAPGLRIEDVEYIARTLRKTGVTRFLPTVVTADLETLCHQLATIAEAIETVPWIAGMCPGIHLEGPFINPEDGPRGAHRRQYVRDPGIADFDRLWSAARGRILMLTLAPERPNAVELIRHAGPIGVIVALGHHRADADALDRAVAAGARISTHLGNGVDAVLPRLGGPIWQQLGDDRLWATFIADGHHLPPHTLRSMLRAKTLERSILVTDAAAVAGLPPGRYEHNGFEVELTADGRITIPGTPYLAGSAADMPTVVARAVRDGGISFPEAVRLATLQPEAFLGLTPWSCEPGKPVNLVELLWNPRDAFVTVRRVVHQAPLKDRGESP